MIKVFNGDGKVYIVFNSALVVLAIKQLQILRKTRTTTNLTIIIGFILVNFYFATSQPPLPDHNVVPTAYTN